MKRRAQRVGMNPRETCDSVSVLLQKNGKQSSRNELLAIIRLANRANLKKKKQNQIRPY